MSRPAYESLPTHVRAGLEHVLGWPVVSAASETGGWSPGVAARVQGPRGERAFVKAVSSEVNKGSAHLHRREAEVTALLPSSVGSPRLLGSSDDGTWVALALQEVDGRPPVVPWLREELEAALRTLERLADVPAWPGLTPVQESQTQLGGWSELARSGAALTDWQRRHLGELCELEAGWAAAATGDRLLHLDARDDNLLVRPDGEMVLVDWPWAAAGNPVLDLLAFAQSAALRGAPPPQELITRTTTGRRADPDEVTALVAGLAGMFLSRAARPPTPGMAAVRAFQAAQGRVCAGWVRQRTGWH